MEGLVKHTNHHQLYPNILPTIGSRKDKFPKKDAWICWTVDQDASREITDFRVYDTYKYKGVTAKVTAYMRGRWMGDIGNNIINWDSWELCDVLFKFAFQYKMDTVMQTKVLRELAQIEEWHDAVSGYLLLIDVELDF